MTGLMLMLVLGGPQEIEVPTKLAAVRQQSLLGITTQTMHQGTVQVGGDSYSLFMARASYHRVENLRPTAGLVANTSTPILVDHDHNGILTADESRFASLPLRLGDCMFQVQSIAADASQITLVPMAGPLLGAIVGRSCPPFSFTTRDGKPVTLADFRDKILLVDVWSVT